jgi:ATP synthase protein I
MSAGNTDRPEQPEASSLSERIARWEAEHSTTSAGNSKMGVPKNGFALAGRVTTELVSGLVVGAFIGFWLDKWLDTAPLFMVVLFFVGAVAGMFNVWRALSGKGMAAGYFDEQNSGDTSEAAETKKGES